MQSPWTFSAAPERSRTLTTVPTLSYTRTPVSPALWTHQTLAHAPVPHRGGTNVEGYSQNEGGAVRMQLGRRRWRPYDWADHDDSEEAARSSPAADPEAHTMVSAAFEASRTTCENAKPPLRAAPRRPFSTPFLRAEPAAALVNTTSLARKAPTLTICRHPTFPAAACSQAEEGLDSVCGAAAEPSTRVAVDDSTGHNTGTEEHTCDETACSILLSQSSSCSDEDARVTSSYPPSRHVRATSFDHASSHWFRAHQRSLRKRPRCWSDRFLRDGRASVAGQRAVAHRTELDQAHSLADDMYGPALAICRVGDGALPADQVRAFHLLCAYYSRVSDAHAPYPYHSPHDNSQAGLSSQSDTDED